MADIVICGRVFSSPDLEVIRELISIKPPLNRRKIATETCARLGWMTAAGKWKEMSCRVALLRLEKLGVIKLPPPQNGNGNRKQFTIKATLSAPDEKVTCGVGEFEFLQLQTVRSREQSRLWNEAIDRFHYLGYQRLAGAQMRYLLESEKGLLAAIGFGASAWKVAPRDRWIGWTVRQRESRLHLVINNARFLILPWVRSRNLASWILGRCARQIADDFEARYGYRPVLVETFVQKDRFHGTCYQAANWRYLGETQGRGKLDRYRRSKLPTKKIYVCPLAANFREVLCS